MVVRVHPRQLALALPHAESLTRDNFLDGAANAQALALIDGWPDWPNRVMMLAGPEGSGKSHLATIWATEAGARSIAARTLTPANVPGELTTGALVVDDLDPASFDERALFHLLNLAREDGAYILLTGRISPSSFGVTLHDLRSRLRAVPVIALTPPDDQLFRALIVKFCADRQMSVDESLVSYLATRIERSFAAARRSVEQIDEEALRRGRPVTRALAAEVLKDPAA
ncbi:chromosomal replication initiator protein DnaA [Bradyrhizobiaceae bacterium SG-6C]|nr:chromosomal replication initiator protein DnaA [Bradyrhizobiaceae bacterium SG-6C]